MYDLGCYTYLLIFIGFLAASPGIAFHRYILLLLKLLYMLFYLLAAPPQ